MAIKAYRLGPDNFYEVMNLLKDARESDPMSAEAETRYEWLMSHLYLPGPNHALFGSFRDGYLIAMVGMRLDMPIPRAWSLTNLKTRRNTPIGSSGLRECLTMLFEAADRRELNEYYTCMLEKRFIKFNRMMNILIPSLYGKYDHHVHLKIPAGTQPEEDLWWGMMGRKTLPYDVIIKRTARREQCVEFLENQVCA